MSDWLAAHEATIVLLALNALIGAVLTVGHLQRRVNEAQVRLNAALAARLAALEKELVDVVRREYAARGKPQ